MYGTVSTEYHSTVIKPFTSSAQKNSDRTGPEREQNRSQQACPSHALNFSPTNVSNGAWNDQGQGSLPLSMSQTCQIPTQHTHKETSYN